MQKRALFIIIFSTVSCLIASQVRAQTDYETAIGLGIDLGSGTTGVGGSAKHFFSENDVAEANLFFYDNSFSIAAYYQYHGDIENADGLKWYGGLGPQIFFWDRWTEIGGRMMVGLDFKIPNVPFDLSFDWRPYLRFNKGTQFTAGRFGIGVRYAF